MVQNYTWYVEINNKVAWHCSLERKSDLFLKGIFDSLYNLQDWKTEVRFNDLYCPENLQIWLKGRKERSNGIDPYKRDCTNAVYFERDFAFWLAQNNLLMSKNLDWAKEKRFIQKCRKFSLKYIMKHLLWIIINYSWFSLTSLFLEVPKLRNII